MTDTDIEAAWAPVAADLRAFVQRRIADAHAAEDIVQDVFVKLARQLAAGPLEGPVPAWLFRVARNAIVDHYRARRPEAAMPADLGDVATDAPSPTADADAKPLFASFRRFLHSLPPEQREALLLTEYEGLTQKALADRLGVAVSTVKSRVQRGRKRLEQALLDCCAFEFDRRGNVVDWQRRPGGDCQDC
ncbi:MAG: RNA polymerase sigma factor SigZ [Planctomycetota bacterium]|nr:RNA polymerase sigma factor SigZ [Planctomycetota bacterium]